MISRTITLPELGLIAGTRAALGVGIGLLIADRIAPEQRRAIGWTLLAMGVATTFPLAATVIHGRGKESGDRQAAPARRGAAYAESPESP